MKRLELIQVLMTAKTTFHQTEIRTQRYKLRNKIA